MFDSRSQGRYKGAMSKCMTKTEVLGLFNGNKLLAAKELRVSRQSIYTWPDDGPIPDRSQSKVRDYYLRIGRSIPRHWMPA